MVARLILFCLGYAMLLSLPVAALIYLKLPRIKELQQEKRKRELAEKNARRLKAFIYCICFECGERCDETDCFEQGKGWYHTKCLQALLG